MTTLTYELNDILTEPLDLDTIRNASLQVPVNSEGEICHPLNAVKLQAYQLNYQRDDATDLGFPDQERCMQATLYGLLTPKGSDKLYSLYAAIDNIMAKDVRALMYGARRTPWEDFTVKSR